MTQALADVVVRLQAQTAQYQARLDQADARIRRFEGQQRRSTRGVREEFSRLERAQRASTDAMGSGLKKLAGAMAAFASANALKNMVTDAIDAANAADDFSVRIGISVEELSKLSFAAESSGVSLSTLEMGLQRMVRRTANAAQGTGEAVKAFKQLNLSAKEMAQLSPDMQFRKIAEALRDVEDSGQRVAIAMKVFDTGGVQMLQMVDGLEAMRQEAEDLGFVMSTKMAKSATEFNAKLVKMKTLFSYAALAVSEQLLPALVAAANKAQQFGEWLTDAFNVDSADRLDELKAKIVDINAELESFQGRESGNSNWITHLKSELSKAGTEAAALQIRLEKTAALASGDKFTLPDIGGADPSMGGAGKAGGADDSADKAAQKMADEEHRIQKMLQSKQDAAARERDAQEAAADAMLDSLLQQLQGEEDAIEASFSRRLEMVAELHKAKHISDEEAANLSTAAFKKRAKEEEDAEREKLLGKLSVASDIAGKMAGLMESENSRINELSRASGIVQATISGAVAFAKALEMGPIAGPIMAAQIAAQTAIQIGTIAGARALGGPVAAGKSYLVGEKGPEIFTPSNAGGGNITPNSGIGGMTVNIVEDASKAGQVDKGNDSITVFVAAAMQQLHSEFNSGKGLFAAMESKYGLAR